MVFFAASFIFITSGIAGALLYRWGRKKRQAQVLEQSDAFRNQLRERVAEITHDNTESRAAFKIKRQAELARTIEKDQQELKEIAELLDARELSSQSREDKISSNYVELKNMGAHSHLLSQRQKALNEELIDLRLQTKVLLEKRSGLQPNDTLSALISRKTAQAQLESQKWLADRNESIRRQAAGESRRIITSAIQRYTAPGHLDRIQNKIPMPNAATFSAWADPEGLAQEAFLDEIDCLLEAQEANLSLHIKGDNPLGREIARRTLRQIANRSIKQPDQIRHFARHNKEEVDREVQNAGKRALKTLRLERVHPEILQLVGRLKFRLSYSQNQLKHAIEVGYLAGIMAAELGLDVSQARRGGLLHDIGKAMTHEHEGSHAVLGAAIARQCGEEEVVANAIGAHHNDEPMKSPIARIVCAADAISGARPGARRETTTLYLERIKNIQRIANRSQDVERVDIMHAGREVRVTVAANHQGEVEIDTPPTRPHLDDSALHPLAQKIAQELEEELDFPGQIRVTVIQESHCVSIAK